MIALQSLEVTKRNLRAQFEVIVWLSIIALSNVPVWGTTEANDCTDWNAVEFFQKASLELVQRCFKEHPLDESSMQNFEKPLFLAAKASTNPSVVRFLIDAGGRLNPRERPHGVFVGDTPIIAAARANSSGAVLKTLVVGGAVLEFERAPIIPLHVAAKFNPIAEITETLLDLGSSVNREWKKSTEWTAMNLALRYNPNPRVTTLLVEHGADVNQPDKYGRMPLDYAVTLSDDASITQLIVQHAADVNAAWSDGRTALHRAAQYATDPLVVETLLKAGANVDQIDQFGSAPLHYAVVRDEYFDIVSILVQAGADVNTRDRLMVSPLHLASWYNRNSKIVRVLLSEGADADALTREGDNALRRSSSSEVVRLLLTRGVDPHYRTNYGETIAHTVSNSVLADTSLIQVFQDKRIDMDAIDAFGNSALHVAVRDQDVARVDSLLKFGADVTKKNKDGYTALQLTALQVSDLQVEQGYATARNWRLERKTRLDRDIRTIASTLIKYGANPRTTGTHGKSFNDLITTNSAFLDWTP